NKTFTTTIVGLESVSVGKVKAYPNPFNEQVSITNTGELERLIVKNIFGQKVVEYDLNGRKYINTSAFPKGIYLFIFSDNAGNQRTHKMVKQ
ncbi:MAG: T9SS type A sorting domain-containing protein, partial [Bacteroidales bacterium]|nr:T9SS type A sorting domain-containing protein [Bacteroidales bacterium]